MKTQTAKPNKLIVNEVPYNHVLVITYISGKMEWMPHNTKALEHISTCYDLIEFMEIVPMGPNDLQRYATNDRIVVIINAMMKREWMPMDVTTLDYIAENHEMIEWMDIVDGVQ